MTEWKPPTFMTKLTGFSLSFAAWAGAGFPRRSPEWVKEIFETHCQPCAWYDANRTTLLSDQGICIHCACHVSGDAENMRNKIVMPNNSCPLDPPKWGSDVDKIGKPKDE